MSVVLKFNNEVERMRPWYDEEKGRLTVADADRALQYCGGLDKPYHYKILVYEDMVLYANTTS